MKYLHLILASAIFLLPSHGHALQRISFVSEGDGGVLKVSRRDANLIKFPIEDVQVYTRSKIAEVKVDRGNVVVAYTTENPQDPIDLLFVTPEGPYSLTLIPADIPSEIIMVDVPGVKKSGAKERIGDSGEDSSRVNSDYVSRVKELLKGMYSEEAPYGYSNKKVNRPVASLPDLSQTLEEIYSGPRLTGERYRLINSSMHTVNLSENQFHQKDILAVSLEQLSLDPGEETSLYIVRKSGSQVKMESERGKYRLSSPLK
jgi:hypothetical protein